MALIKLRVLTSRLVLAVCLLLFHVPVPPFISPCFATDVAPAAVDETYKVIEALVKEYYPSAKFTKLGSGMHFEYKLKSEMGYYSNRPVLAPQEGGILGDISLEPGLCSERQAEIADGFHTTMTIGPYSKNLNSHLLVKLTFPANGFSVEFRDKFVETANHFGDGDSTVPHPSAADAGQQASSGTVATTQPPKAPSAPGAPESSAARLPTSSAEAPQSSTATSSPDQAKQTPQTVATAETPGATANQRPITSTSRFSSGFDNAHPDGSPSLFNSDNFPENLPEITTKRKALKVGVTKTVNADDQLINQLKTSPEGAVYASAQKAMKKGNYDLSRKIYESLCARRPKDPRYFFGAGSAYRMMGNAHDAFSNYVIAWHLGGSNPAYREAAEATVVDLQHEIDDTFKLTYGFDWKDPECLLNAGARCWKAGLTKQSTQLFAYAMRTEPLYARVAAFDLGATAEHNGQLKLALQYYDWALKDTARLEAERANPKMDAGAIDRSFHLLSRQYVEQARSDVATKLRINDTRWFGWTQATSYPAHWSTEICPLCTVCRTDPAYRIGSDGF